MSFFEKAKTAAAQAHATYKKVKKGLDDANARRIEREKEQKQKEAEQRREYERVREATKQFEFWHYRGKAYGIKKERYRDGDYNYVMTECYLDMKNGKTDLFRFLKCDLPVGNGHEMVLIFSKAVGAKSGNCVRAINLSTKTYVDIEHYLDMIQNQSGLGRQYGLARLNRDLVQYVNSI